jgi:hypothetical protein
MKHISARTTRFAGAVALAAAAALGGTGIASASVSPATSGTERFYLMTTSGTATKLPVIANGVFTAAGVDHEGNTVDTVQLPKGTFEIMHPGGPSGAPKVNKTTCFFTFTETTPFKVGHGTGAYRGISGSGKAVITIVGILGRIHGGACSDNVNPVAWQQTFSAKANIKL